MENCARVYVEGKLMIYSKLQALPAQPSAPRFPHSLIVTERVTVGLNSNLYLGIIINYNYKVKILMMAKTKFII
jgi:hypothetical protein